MKICRQQNHTKILSFDKFKKYILKEGVDLEYEISNDNNIIVNGKFLIYKKYWSVIFYVGYLNNASQYLITYDLNGNYLSNRIIGLKYDQSFKYDEQSLIQVTKKMDCTISEKYTFGLEEHQHEQLDDGGNGESFISILGSFTIKDGIITQDDN